MDKNDMIRSRNEAANKVAQAAKEKAVPKGNSATKPKAFRLG